MKEMTMKCWNCGAETKPGPCWKCSAPVTAPDLFDDLLSPAGDPEQPSRAAEALTLDCRTERRGVPAERILDAIRRVVDGWTFGDDDEPLRDHLYYSAAEASLEDADEAITDLCEDIAEAVVEVLGGES